MSFVFSVQTIPVDGDGTFEIFFPDYSNYKATTTGDVIKMEIIPQSETKIKASDISIFACIEVRKLKNKNKWHMLHI